MIELSPEAARAAPGVLGLIVSVIASAVYLRAKKIVDRQRAERGDRVGAEARRT
jgi:hypothetical protein